MKSKYLSMILVAALIATGCTDIQKKNVVQAKDVNNGTYHSKRLSGNNRYDTALAIANEYSTGSLDNIVIATGNDFPDALAGSVLAAKLNAPILLVGGGNSDTANVMSYINGHLKKNGNVFILGGVGVVPNFIVDNLKSNGYNNVTRLGGANREETAKLIDNTINVAKGTPVVIVTENDFPDALSISSIAGVKGYPILLSGKNGLPQTTKDLLKGINPSKVYIIGGTGVLTSNIESDVKSTISIDNSSITRISGANRYETSLNIAKAFNLDTTNSVLATGNDFPDALAGSVLAAKLNAPILLIDNNDVSTQKQFLDNTKISNIVMLGGNGAINSNVESKITAPVQVGGTTQPSQPSVGMQTPTGIVSGKITYTDKEIQDNPTFEQMLALPNVVTVTPQSNPEMFMKSSSGNYQILNIPVLNLTNKIIHASWTTHIDGMPDMHKDCFVKILSEKLDSVSGIVVDKTFTSVDFNDGQLLQLRRNDVTYYSNREEANYIYNEK